MRRFLALGSRNVVAVVSVSMFMVQLDAAVLAIALPEIAADFDRPAVSLSLAITIYLTMLVAVLPASGWAADRFGPRRIFILATLGFGLFSLLCALSQSFWPFIVARAMQGTCASLMTPVARLILLKRTSKAELVDALAITAMPMLVAPTLGPSLGGFIVDYASWEYIFLLNVPVALALIAATLRVIPEIAPEGRPKLDWRGALLLSAALAALLTGLDRLASDISNWAPWALLLSGVLLARLTWRHLRTHADPVISLAPLGIAPFRTTATGAGALVRIPARAALFALPLMFQLGLGLSAFVAGLLLMAMNAGDLLMKPLLKPLFDRFGFRTSVIAGSMAGLAGLVAIALPDSDTAAPDGIDLGLIGLSLIVVGISRSIVFTGMASLTFVSLGTHNMTSGNVLASISMQMFNAIAISGTALLLGLSAQTHAAAEPDLLDFRIVLVATALLGLWATIALRRQLPHDLREVHADHPI